MIVIDITGLVFYTHIKPVSNQANMTNKSSLPFLLIIPLSIMLVGQIFAKKSGIYISEGGSILNIYSLVSYACLISRGLLWIFIIRRMRLVFAYPVMSLNYILVLLVSYFLFHEKIYTANIAGAGLIGLGVILVGIGESNNAGKS